MKKFSLLFFVSFLFTSVLMSQTPQYYNFDNGTVSNSFPLNQAAGKLSQTVVPAGTFITPTPAPAGNVTKLYFRISGSYSLGPATYTDFKIMMLHVSSEFVTSGSFITGAWDTVFSRASISLTAAMNTWVEFTLDHPFPYNPAQPLAISMEQCGATGTVSGYSLRYTSATGSRRIYSVGGCPYVYSGVSTNIINCGIDISSAPTVCNYYSSQWCALSAFPNLPAATYFSAADWLGDTLYVHTPSSAGASSTTINRYKYGGSWSTGVPLPAAKTGGTLTKCGTKLYYIGGGSSVTVGSTDVYEYDPATGVWTTKAPLPAALSAHGSVCWGDSVIFVVGGPYSGAGTNLNVHYYRPASNTWGTITNSLPSGQGRRTFSIGITGGNKIVISCGYNTAYLKSTYVGTIGANASVLTWAPGLDAPQSLSRSAGASYGNYFYVIGGDTNGTAVKNTKVYIYNVGNNSWFYTVLNNPNAVSNICSGVTAHCVNDTVRIFQPGGYTTLGTANFVVLGCGPTIVGNSTITSNVPSSYSLSQNYPNPFNPTTKIAFSLPRAGDVKLVVYDILGKEVTTLVNDYRTAGTHSIEFNASNLASGVYLYRIEAGDFRDVKRMMLVK